MFEFEFLQQLRKVLSKEINRYGYFEKNNIKRDSILTNNESQKEDCNSSDIIRIFVIRNCTSDISHIKQINLMVHFVTTAAEPSENTPAVVTVRVHFLEFTRLMILYEVV